MVNTDSSKVCLKTCLQHPDVIEFLIPCKVFKPQVNGRFLIDYNVHCWAFGGTGLCPTGMTSLNTFQKEKII